MAVRYALTILTIALMAGVALSVGAGDFQIIVNAGNSLTSVSKAELSNLFLRKTPAWPNGQPAVPIDLAPNSTVRASFSTSIHGRDVPAIKSYWQRQIFSGKGVPPVEQPSEQQVIAFVTANPGAVGYVNKSAALTDLVKVLHVKD